MPLAVRFDALPPAVRQRFVQLTHAPDQRVVHHWESPRFWGIATFLGVPLVIACVVMEGTLSRKEAPLPIFLASALAAYLLGAAILSGLRRATPFKPGYWVFASHAVHADDGRFTVLELLPHTTFRGQTTKIREGRKVRRSSSLVIQSGGATMLVPIRSRTAPAGVAAAASQAHSRYVAAYHQGDHAALQWMNPFYECTLSGQWGGRADEPGPRCSPLPRWAKVAYAVVPLAIAAAAAYASWIPNEADLASDAEDAERERVALAKEGFKQRAIAIAADREAMSMLKVVLENAERSHGPHALCMLKDPIDIPSWFALRSPLSDRGPKAFQAAYGQARPEAFALALSTAVARNLNGWTVSQQPECKGWTVDIFRMVKATATKLQAADGPVEACRMEVFARFYWLDAPTESPSESEELMAVWNIDSDLPSGFAVRPGETAQQVYKRMLDAHHEVVAAKLVREVFKPAR